VLRVFEDPEEDLSQRLHFLEGQYGRPSTASLATKEQVTALLLDLSVRPVANWTDDEPFCIYVE
jgi:hypothetical protein